MKIQISLAFRFSFVSFFRFGKLFWNVFLCFCFSRDSLAGLIRLWGSKQKVVYRVFSPTAVSAGAGENFLAMESSRGRCKNVFFLHPHLETVRWYFFEFPWRGKSSLCTWSLSSVVLRCLLMTALICRMDVRSKTCRLALETVKEIGKFRGKIRAWRTRVKKNDFVIKKGRISSCFGEKSRFSIIKQWFSLFSCIVCLC